jgi:formylglycine-generating enzyme required for sulfatase activity
VGKKVLSLLDQFEHWLHAKREETNTELVQSLRQCDGGRLQCIVMVRDDFWMAVIRFMRELEIRLLEGQNSAAVDLFDRDHARKVLAAFGRAFGKLPESSGETSKEQKEFLKQAVSGLAQEGKIICVRLALFAEMMKGKAWTPATLKEVGGTAGVGATFLEETFSAGTAPPEHRYHQKAARVVLKALLPESVTDIRGHMRSYADLLKLSGYESRPKDFDDLIRLLDNEIRLITPTDPEGKEDDSASSMKAGEKYYQLTHDYLVHSLRDWLTRKQKETRRGRAELRLAERSALWNAKPENRHLPAWWEFLHVRLLVGKKNWTDPQRRMMWKAGRYHAFRGCLLAAILIMIGWGSYEGYGHLRAAALRERLLDASTTEVPQIVQEIKPLRRWADSRLREAFSEAEAKGDFRRQLHASLALLPWDAGQRDYLYERLLNAEPQEVPAIRDALAPHKEVLTDTLWAVVEQPAQGKERQRLRAACALAAFDPDSQRWEEVKGKVADDLVREPAVYLATWIECLRPVTANLLEPLGAIFRDTNRRETERSLATDILADYAADQASMLADLVLDADEKQFAVLFPKLKGHGEDGARPLLTEIHKLSVAENDKENLAKRQANAAVALLRMDRPEEVWPLLKHRPDPRVRSYLIHRLAPMGADPRAILKRLEEEPDLTIRRALLLTLGEFGERAFEGGERELLMEKLRYLYRNDRDPGLHAAAEWLLRTWKQQQWLKQAEQEWAKNKQQREQRCQSVRQELAQKKGEVKPQWYVTGEGQTMVVIPGPVEFLMGSPTSEPGRSDNETLHLKRIGHTFAIAAKAVTLDQYLRFRRDYDYKRQYAPVGDCPVHGTPWYQAAEYCNWLSDQAGLPEHEWCYERNKGGRYEAGMKPAANYLQRTGYRLPTEAEWEYACRAGAVTSRYYGQSEELLGKYDWYLKNSGDRTWPVGSLKPNDFGLFDMHGNVWAWCHDSYRLYEAGQRGKAAEDSEDNSLVPDATSRVLRGGGFLDQPRYLRSAYRNWDLPGTRSNALGFRPARTYN